EVVAIDLQHRPAEGLPLVDDRLEVEDLLDEAVELNAVVVQNHTEIVNAVIRRPEAGSGHRAFPDLALLDLPVADDAVHTRALARELEAEGHARRHRQPLAERARRGLDARQRDAVGMALERAAQLAQRHEEV